MKADKIIQIRNDFRNLTFGLFCPKTLISEENRKALNIELKERWRPDTIDIYELIREDWKQKREGSYLVFIDTDFDIDWINERTDQPAEKAISYAESIGARRCKHLPLEQILEFRRLIGQAIVNGIEGEADYAAKLADEAARFLKDRTIERSRSWTLQYAHFIFLFFSIVVGSVCGSPSIWPCWQISDPLLLWLAIQGGLLGAYISTLQKAGKGEWDAAAGRSLHFLEVFTKIFAGGIFGGIAFILTRSVNAPLSLKQIAPDEYSAFILGIVAGFVERWIPKMISNYSEIGKQNKQN